MSRTAIALGPGLLVVAAAAGGYWLAMSRMSTVIGASSADHVVGGDGREVMQRIAAPMIEGMITAPLLSMLVIPAAHFVMRRRGLSPRGDV
jgi:hypothetical protein